MAILAAAFTLDDLAFPPATQTPHFGLDDFQWPGVGAEVQAGPPAVLAARDCGRVLDADDCGAVRAARDCGRVLMADRCSWSGTICLRVGEVRALGIDFAALAELQGGDELTGTPAVTIDAGSGVLVSSPAIDGSVVEAVFDATAGEVADADLLANGGDGGTEYQASFTADTVAGSTLSRSCTVRIEQ